jgi:gentisate 1,2-dioxygenase
MTDKLTAIISLVPNAEVNVRGDVVEWINPTTAPVTDAQIDAEMVRLQAEYDAKQYQRDRALAYPSLKEQLDMQYWDSVNGTTVWQDTINAIKAKYPKVG